MTGKTRRRPKRIQGKSDRPAKSFRPTIGVICKVRCKFCGRMNGPIQLDGKNYICSHCKTSLFGYNGPSFDELCEKAVEHAPTFKREGFSDFDVSKLEQFSRGEVTREEIEEHFRHA